MSDPVSSNGTALVMNTGVQCLKKLTLKTNIYRYMCLSIYMIYTICQIYTMYTICETPGRVYCQGDVWLLSWNATSAIHVVSVCWFYRDMRPLSCIRHWPWLCIHTEHKQCMYGEYRCCVAMAAIVIYLSFVSLNCNVTCISSIEAKWRIYASVN